ncbi:MAG: Stp1/IreP family PP2C-type Ser/Thr phosphatase [Coriobacteriia bacterium]|nr:Stp1/IreP family PP2C-type Ser/Thr phosphatase [Coriobacteriia bacterium]
MTAHFANRFGFKSAKAFSRLDVAATTSIGRVRTNNEDAHLVAESLFAVADGMGGHEAGEIASNLAIETLKTAHIDLSKPENLSALVAQANMRVMDAPEKGIGRVGMGTTLTAAVIDNDLLLIAQVGDSRAYLLREKQLHRLTRDHSYVQELVASGKITEEEARQHPRRGVITRVLGFETQTEPDLYREYLQQGDRLLLCTDGLHGLLADPRIEQIMVEERTAQQCAAALVRAANKAGGLDNTTVVVIDVMTIAPTRKRWYASLGSILSRDSEGGSGSPGNGGSGSNSGSGTGGSTRLSSSMLESQLNGRPTTRLARDWQLPTKRRHTGIIAFLLALLLLFGAAASSVYIYASRSAYVIAEDGQVVIYRGLIGDIFGFRLQWKVAVTEIEVDDLNPYISDRLYQGIQLKSLEEAESLVEQYREQIERPPR